MGFGGVGASITVGWWQSQSRDAGEGFGVQTVPYTLSPTTACVSVDEGCLLQRCPLQAVLAVQPLLEIQAALWVLGGHCLPWVLPLPKEMVLGESKACSITTMYSLPTWLALLWWKWCPQESPGLLCLRHCEGHVVLGHRDSDRSLLLWGCSSMC